MELSGMEWIWEEWGIVKWSAKEWGGVEKFEELRCSGGAEGSRGAWRAAEESRGSWSGVERGGSEERK